MGYDTSTIRHGAMSSGAAAALGIAGAANPVRGAPAAAQSTGPNDRKIRDAWHERNRLLCEVDSLDTSHLDVDDEEAVRDPYFAGVTECEVTITRTPADGAVGAAIKARLAYVFAASRADNQFGEAEPDGLVLDVERQAARLLADLDRIAAEV